MAFTVADVDDFVRVLRSHPEWREAVRQEVLGRELLSLPDLVRQNGEDIRALSAEVRALAALVAQNTSNIEALQGLVAQNSRDIARNSNDIARLFKRVVRVEGRLGDLQGAVGESRWRDGFAGRFGNLIDRARLVTPRDLDQFEDALTDGTIGRADANAVRSLDLIIEGVLPGAARGSRALLAVEISARIEAKDVTRAVARAATLAAVGYTAVPVVAGAIMDESLQSLASAQGVRVVLRPQDLTEFADYPDGSAGDGDDDR